MTSLQALLLSRQVEDWEEEGRTAALGHFCCNAFTTQFTQISLNCHNFKLSIIAITSQTHRWSHFVFVCYIYGDHLHVLQRLLVQLMNLEGKYGSNA